MKQMLLWRKTVLLLIIVFFAMTRGSGDLFNAGAVYGAPLSVSDFTAANTPVLFNFDAFTGAGFSPTPSAGQLDSNQFIVTGFTDGSVAYGGTATTGDFARGSSAGGVTTGGIYAFTISSGDNILGVQPTGDDFTPGTIEMRIQNNTGATITSVDVNYDVAVRNDQARSNSFNLLWATGSGTTPGTFTAVAGGNLTTPEAASGSSWTSTPFDLAISGLSIAAGDYLFLRWSSDDVGGSGSRDEFGLNNLSLTPNPTGGDTTPPVVSTFNPADNATNVAVDANLVVTFNENVQKGTGNITIHLAADNSVVQTIDVTNAAVTVSGAQVTINPPADLTAGTAYYVNMAAGAIEDTAGNDFAGITDATTWNFTTQAAIGACGTSATLISAIQGSGTSTPVDGQNLTIEGIVVADYQGTNNLSGFFVQEENADGDGNAATSEGIFVFEDSASPIVEVSVGDLVRVNGTVDENFGVTSLDIPSILLCSSNNTLPTLTQVQLPIPGFTATDPATAATQINAYFEPFEGMLVQFAQALTVAEHFELSRFGQIVLASERLRQYTDQNTTLTAAGYQQHLATIAAKSIILDDDNNIQNAALVDDGTADDDPVFYPEPGGFSITNFFRTGDTITGLTGVLDFAFSEWHVRPVAEVYDYTFSSANPRPATPANVNGTLKVASFNVLNYFKTIDTTASNDTGNCGPSGTLDCRGADSEAERVNQLNKIVAALNAMNADIFGLIELENNASANPANNGDDPVLEDIVDALNAVNASTYSFIDTGTTGTDAIRVALIYKTNTVSPVGSFAILDSSVDPTFIDTRNRPALAQTFQQTSNGAKITVVVNHFKSKGSGCGGGDDDTTTGQGNCNGTRTAAATALANWLTTDPTTSGDPDFLIIGDLNSYRNEDPIVALKNAGYSDLNAQFNGAGAYSYLFDGQLGYLDHALANPSLQPQVTGVTEWHINADEVNLLDYNDQTRDTGEADSFEKKPGPNPLYEANPYRSADHDPVIIGLQLALSINSSVTQGTPTTSNNPTPQPCAATGTNLAIYTINSPMTNSSANSFANLFFRVKTLEYTTPQGGQKPSLCNATTVVNNGGVGSILTVPNSSLPGGDNEFDPTETLTQAFQIGRPVAAQFRIQVDLFSNTVAAAGTAGAGEIYLGSFDYIFDPSNETFTPVQQLFLPLVIGD